MSGTEIHSIPDKEAGQGEGSKLSLGNLRGWTGFEVMSVWV